MRVVSYLAFPNCLGKKELVGKSIFDVDGKEIIGKIIKVKKHKKNENDTLWKVIAEVDENDKLVQVLKNYLEEV